MDANKSKALEAALGQIERQFGKGTVMQIGRAHVRTPVTEKSRMPSSA